MPLVRVSNGGSISSAESLGMVQPGNGATQSITLAKDYSAVICTISTNNGTTPGTNNFTLSNSAGRTATDLTGYELYSRIYAYFGCKSGESFSVTRNYASAIRLCVYGLY